MTRAALFGLDRPADSESRPYVHDFFAPITLEGLRLVVAEGLFENMKHCIIVSSTIVKDALLFSFSQESKRNTTQELLFLLREIC